MDFRDHLIFDVYFDENTSCRINSSGKVVRYGFTVGKQSVYADYGSDGLLVGYSCGEPWASFDTLGDMYVFLSQEGEYGTSYYRIGEQ